jgi:hypothetical protein
MVKTRVVLDLNTRVKVIHASERNKLSIKQIMNMFNMGKLTGVPRGGGLGGSNPSRNYSEVLTKSSRIPSSVENTS